MASAVQSLSHLTIVEAAENNISANIGQVVKASREAGGNYKVEVCQADLDAYNARIAKEFAVRDFSKKSQIEILAEKELEKQKVKAERRAAKEKKKANKLAEEEAKKHGKDGPKLTKKERRALEAGF